MYNGKNILALIPARKGSKRVKEKNGRKIGEKRLFEYSIEIAKQSKYIDEVLFSTDSQEWLDIAINLGCYKTQLRSEKLAKDDTRTIEVILYEIEKNKLDINYFAIVLLQPTSPYRTVELLYVQ